jgi:hypothetical protein
MAAAAAIAGHFVDIREWACAWRASGDAAVVTGDAAFAGTSETHPAKDRAAAIAAAPTSFLITIFLRSLLDTLKITRIADFRSSRSVNSLNGGETAGPLKPGQEQG